MTNYYDKESSLQLQLKFPDVNYLKKRASRVKFEDIYQQENVHIEKRLAEAIRKIARKKGKGGKMEIYNPLRLYLLEMVKATKKEKEKK